MDTNTISRTYGFTNKFCDLPITTCILLIFDHLAGLFISRHGLTGESLNKGDKYAKYVMKKLEEFKVASTTHDVLALDQTAERFKVTEVMQVGNNRFFVHLIDRVCS